MHNYMETTINFQYIPQDSRAHRYILPHTPNEAYKQHNLSMAQILKQTERCPFPRIREFIIMFKRPDVINNDLQLPDLLREKYYSSPQYEIQDRELNAMICQGEDTYNKLFQIQKCTNYYNTLYKQVRNSLADEYEQKMRKIKREVQQNQSEIEDVQKMQQKLLMGPGQGSSANLGESREIENNRDHIQKQLQKLDQKRIEIYRENENKYGNANRQVLDIENSYFTFVAFSQELERALIIASASQIQLLQVSKEDPLQKKSERLDNIGSLEEYTKSEKNNLMREINESNDALFEWRENVKNGKITDSKKKQLEIRKQKIKQKLMKMNVFYSKLANLAPIFSNDRQNTRDIFLKATQGYQNFLPEYIQAKQVNEIYSKRRNYLEIIRDEKRKIQKHLQDNFGLIVPYSPSEEFENFIKPLQDHEKSYLKQLFWNQLKPLEEGILYINQEYQKMYKGACSRQESARRSVQKWMQTFKKYENVGDKDNDLQDNNGFVILLQESCRKLMWMLK